MALNPLVLSAVQTRRKAGGKLCARYEGPLMLASLCPSTEVSYRSSRKATWR